MYVPVKQLLTPEGQMWTSHAVDEIFVRFYKIFRLRSLARLAVLTILAGFSLLSSRTASAQAVYGSIFGTITDSSGAVVPNATVTVTDVAKNTSITVQSDASGQYRAQHLIPDTYTVSAEAPNFKISTAQNVVVYADTAPKIDLAL